MPRARALVAAVPQRVWTAVAGLVLLASLGVTLVLTAGLSTWRGAVDNPPDKGNAAPPGSVVTPPSSAVIVVPTPHTHRPAPAAPQHPAATHPAATNAGATNPAPTQPTVVTATPPPAPVAAPPVTAPVPPPPVVASPRVTHGSAHRSTQGKHAKHGNHGKHLGWFKNKHGERS